MTPERKLVFQIFCLLKTNLVDVTRNSFHLEYVISIKDRLSVDLTQETLKRSMGEILSPSVPTACKKASLARVYAVGDGKLNPDNLHTIAEADESRKEEVDREQLNVQERCCDKKEKAAR